jgi:hypothetical protein
MEKAAGNSSAYVPDLPGCIATGDTPEEVEELLREAIARGRARTAFARPRPPAAWIMSRSVRPGRDAEVMRPDERGVG